MKKTRSELITAIYAAEEEKKQVLDAWFSVRAFLALDQNMAEIVYAQVLERLKECKLKITKNRQQLNRLPVADPYLHDTITCIEQQISEATKHRLFGENDASWKTREGVLITISQARTCLAGLKKIQDETANNNVSRFVYPRGGFSLKGWVCK